MTHIPQNIPITEVWDRTDWQNFDGNQVVTSNTILGALGSAQYPFGLSTQKHINVRNFTPVENWEIIAVGELLPMEGLFPSSFVFPGGSIDATGVITTNPSPAYNNWPMATMDINPGTNIYVNVVAESIYSPVDITTIGSDSELTVALPSFPLADIDLTNSYLGISSDGFASNQILLPWSQSTVTPTNGHTRLAWSYQTIMDQVDDIDPTKINGIVLFITATFACTVRFMALRMIHEQWVQTDVDFNTLTNHLTQSIPLNGDPTAVNLPSNQNLPILWRSGDVAGPDDPRPIDAEISAVFNTGTALNNLTQTQAPQGNWIGSYGSDGYYLPAFNGGVSDISNLPFFSAVVPSGGLRNPASWASSTTDIRALQDPTGTFRNAYAYYTTTSETIQFTASQDYNGTMSVYCVDWDATTRDQTLQCQGQTAHLTSFHNGAWVTFAVSVNEGQSVTLTVTANAVSAVVSGIFFGGGPAVSGSCAIYMRGQSRAFITQLDLQNQTQTQLTGQSLTLGTSTRTPRTISDLERYTMGGLDNQTMLNLEAMEDIVTSSWIKFAVQWGNAPMAQITDSADPNEGYQYTNVRLAPATDYLMIGNLTENAAQMWIYQLDSHMALSKLVFDSGLIPDRSQFPRFRGRIGFQASLENDAYVGAIRPRKLMFAEYRSAVLQSITPVSGARLFSDQTPDTKLWQAWTTFADQAGNEPSLSADTTRSTTGSSTAVKIINTSSTPQGIASNQLTPTHDPISGITDFQNFEIEFDLWFPSSGFQPTGQNLCPNPSFEHDANSTPPADWAAPSFSLLGVTSTFLVETGWTDRGAHSLRATATSVSSHGAMQGGLQNYVPAIQGLSYSAQIAFNVLSAATSGQISIDFYDKNNLHLSGFSHTAGTSSPGIYTLTLTNEIAPPNAAFVNVSWGLVNQSNASATVDGYIDSVMLVQASTLPSYFDGDTPGYTWAGIPGNSISVTGQPLVAQLVSDNGAIYGIDLPKIIPNQWQHFDLEPPLAPPMPPSGLYQFVLNYYGVPATFWVDGVEIGEESMQWDARSVTSDVWHSNYAPWTKFTDADDLLNSDTSGVRFSTQGTQLQVRGQALKQNTAILNAPKIIPKYAQLGRLIWPEDYANPTFTTSAILATGNSSAGSNNAGVGTVAWSNPNNVGTPGSYATFASSTNGALSNYLFATGYGLSIPGTATVTGIMVSFLRDGTQTLYSSPTGVGNATGGISDTSVQLIKSGVLTGTNYARLSSGDPTGLWSTTPTMVTYGHANDLWNNTWLPFEANTMGVALAAQVNTGGGVTQTGAVDYAMVTVFYQLLGTTSYLPGVVVKSTNVGRTFTFDGTSSISAQAPIGNWYWSFGDGTFDSGAHATHTYQYAGTYISTLKVTDGFGNSNTGWQTVNVS